MEQIHRRSLPHWYKPGAAHFITYRLADTLPLAVISELKSKKEQLLAQPTQRTQTGHRMHVNKLLFAAYEKHLDQQSEINFLQDPRVASMLRENLYHHDATKYHLHAYCIMPNHVHVLITPDPDQIAKAGDEPSIGETADKRSPLSSIMHSLKSYTANQANKLLHRSGRFWQAESYDHWVRNDEELERIVNYIRANPVAAGLVEKHEDWYWSSCHDRFLMDGDTTAWIPHNK